VKLTRSQAEWCAFGLRQAVELARLVGVRVRPELPALLQLFEDELAVGFASETESHGAPEELEASLIGLIGVAEAAEILGVSPQYVRRIADALGGRRTSAGWVFDRAAVDEYGKERRRR